LPDEILLAKKKVQTTALSMFYFVAQLNKQCPANKTGAYHYRCSA
jgi:hypothetical protein